MLGDPPVIEGNYDRDDQHMLAACSATRGCCLVTTDRRLTIALIREGIVDRYGFEIADLEEAERLLSTQETGDGRQ